MNLHKQKGFSLVELMVSVTIGLILLAGVVSIFVSSRVTFSTNERTARLQENGRIVVMFCAFEGPPRIVRLHGEGEVVLPGDEAFAPLLATGFQEPEAPEARRALIVVHVTRVGDSCGYGVPLMSYEGERPHSDLSTAKRLRVHGPNAMREYEQEHNRESIDGLPALS